MRELRVTGAPQLFFLQHRRKGPPERHSVYSLCGAGRGEREIRNVRVNICRDKDCTKCTLHVSWYAFHGAVVMTSKQNHQHVQSGAVNRLTPNDLCISRTAPLTSKLCILYIYSTNVGTEYFKHALYSPFFSLQNAVCFIMLTSLVPVLFTFYIQGVLKLKKVIPAPKS